MYTKIHFSCAHTNSNLWSDMNHVTELHYIIVKEKQFLSLWKSICKDSSLSFCHSSLVVLIGVSDGIWLPVWELSCDWVTRQEFSVLTVQTLWGGRGTLQNREVSDKEVFPLSFLFSVFKLRKHTSRSADKQYTENCTYTRRWVPVLHFFWLFCFFCWGLLILIISENVLM